MEEFMASNPLFRVETGEENEMLCGLFTARVAKLAFWSRESGRVGTSYRGTCW
jgi:hypothetical protein